ncbi:glycosyltransferase [Thiohalorhabdus sp. Cl-TMA]|uniref:Glycosyltransferase n=1 Tax=Thiohalorhabdus methylotrophus TaxID=3242694 RepID=A0ABV4TPZ6_9GAMM
MRIAFVSPHSDPLAEPGEPDSGGQCVYERRLAATFGEARSDEVRVYTRGWGGKESRRTISAEAEALRIEAHGDEFIRKEDMAPVLPAFLESMWRRDGDWLDSAEVFHGHYWDGGAAALMASLRTGRPLVFTSHSLGREKRDRVPEDGTLKYALRIANEHRVMAAADRIIALTEMEKGILERRYHVDPEKVAVVPAGVDTDAYRPTGDTAALRGKLGLEADERLVFTTGRLDPRKGYDLFLDAIPEATRRLRERGLKARFLLPAGGDALDENERAVRERMDARIAEQGLEDRVILFPHLTLEELLVYYTAADLFVLPSPYEPFGLVAVEAMACGTPVLATRNGGPPEIIDAGSDGALMDPADAGEFGTVMADMLTDRGRLAAMGENARRKAREVFDWRAVAASIREVYGQALASAPT